MNRLTTNSEIQVFKDCKRKWWFKFWRKLRRRREPISKPRDIGSVVHGLLDRYYQGGMELDVLAELITEQNKMLAEFPEQEEDVREVIEYSRIMLEGYFEWLKETGADVPLRVIEPEAEVRVEILEGVDLGGKIDTRVYNEERGARQFLETKTVGSFKERVDMATMNEQIFQYHLLELLSDLEQDSGSRTDGAILNMLRRVKRTSRAKPPFYMRHEVWHNEDELRNFYHRTIGTVLDILRTEQRLADGENPMRVVYPRPSRDCRWKCDFFDVCPMFDDPRTDAEGYLAAHFETHNPTARYTQTNKEEN